MTRYYFHATDGFGLVLDQIGFRLKHVGFEEIAALVAERLRALFGSLADLADWLIVVHADNGDHVVTYALPDLPTGVPQRLAAA